MRTTPTRATPVRTLAACALAAGALASAAACTGGSGTAQSRPGTSAAAGSAGAQPSGGTYRDSTAVLSALKTAGHACAPVAAATPSLSAPGLRSATACSVGSGGGTVTATVFDDHTDAQAYASLLTSAQASGLLIGGTSQRAVLGANWVVLVPDDAAYAEQVSAALGGSVVGPSSSPG